MHTSMNFAATIEPRSNGGASIRVPFDPSAEWGAKERHDVTGTIAGRAVRGTLTVVSGAHFLQLGPAWCRDSHVGPGASVTVVLAPEGPQFSSLATDFKAGLEREPEAHRFFESLATFYRKGFVRWIEAAKRPETRTQRIEETIVALKAGKKQR